MPVPSLALRRSLAVAAGTLAVVLAGWFVFQAVGEGEGLRLAADGRVEAPSGTARPTLPDTASTGQAPVQLSATELFRQYQGSRGRAGDKYLRQRLGLSGVLSEVEQGAGGRAVLSLSAGPDLERIRAVMNPGEQAKVAGLLAGTPVSLNCLHQGSVMGEPVLGDCVIQSH